MGLRQYLESIVQPTATIATGAVAEPLAGLAGLLGIALPGSEGQGSRWVDDVRSELTYTPKTDSGKKGMDNLGQLLQSAKRAMVDNNPPVRKMVEGYDALADYGGEVSPEMGAFIKTLPVAAMTLAGPGSAGVRKAFDSAGTGAGMAAERALTPLVNRTMERGGLPAQLLQDLTEGAQANITSRVNPRSYNKAVAEGYWHPVGDGKKLPIPYDDMTAVRTPIPGMLLPKKTVSPESMLGGVLVPASGDRTMAGHILEAVNGVRLPTPVMLEGGADFMRTNTPDRTVWASDKGAVTGLANRVRSASDISPDVYMPFVAMGHNSANFNTMMSDTLLEQILGKKMTKKAIRQFDEAVKGVRPEFLGVNHPNARAQLNENGALRHAFVDRMQLDDFQDAGFPNIASARYAITEPELMDAPLHSAGYAISKMDPSGRVVSDPKLRHSTYNTQLGGDYFGGLERPVPREVMFRDWYNSRRERGADIGGDPRSFQLSNPIQVANQEWLDGVMKYLEANRASP